MGSRIWNFVRGASVGGAVARLGLIAAVGGVVSLSACSSPTARPQSSPAAASAPQAAPAIMQPRNADYAKPGAPRQPGNTIDLTAPGAVVWKNSPAVIEDMSQIAQPRQVTEPWKGPVMAIGDVTGHKKFRPPFVPGTPNNLSLGGLDPNGARAVSGGMFPAIGATAWTPPDPTLGAGPNHILATVNMAVAWWNKTGTLQFSSNLDNTGNPGFFESVGCGNFTFDPKCFYDHYAGRWVIIAPEVYGSTEAWICIAVSDDSDPNGTWYKYRTDAVINVSGSTYWWDYPGFGYDQNAYYVTGNLFGLNNGGWGGVGYRVFTKAPLLTGQTAVYATLRDGNAASVQIAQCFGSPSAPFFVSTNSGSSLKIQAITNPITSPALATTTVTVPNSSGVGSAPSAGGNSVGMIDGRILNAHWRSGHLYATHDSNVSGTNVARWYHLNTNNWPTSGSVSLVESGNINPGGGKATYFPAIYSNKFHDVAVVVGASSATEKISVGYAGRRSSDAAGTMGPLTQLRLSGANGGGRWGDYQDIAVDPTDDATFWVIGETAESGGWSTWIDKFTITTQAGPFAADDAAGNAFDGTPKTIDVLANDGHSGGDPIVIDTFQATSVHGGAVTRSVGTGPGGRDQLVYLSLPGYFGADSFTYTIKDPANQTATATVSLTVQSDAQFRDPENPSHTAPEIEVAYYATPTTMAVLPDFSTLTPFAETTVPNINQPKTLLGPFMTSGLTNGVSARFVGYLTVPDMDFYTIYVKVDDGAKVYFGNTLLLNRDGTNSYDVEGSAIIGLKAGTHAIVVEYFERTSNLGLTLSYSSSTIPQTVIPASAFSHDSPCPADFDQSGFVDIDDFDAFVDAFELGDDSADFDGSGFVDLDDFDDFVVAFELGC